MDEKEQWIVLQAETCQDEGQLWTAATIFDSFEEAKSYVNDIIRDEWNAKVQPEDSDGHESLADHPGYVFPSGCIKHSDIYYSEEGDEAWLTPEYGGYNIKICKIGKKGQRIC